MFPDNCIQNLLLSWWEKKIPSKRERWRLAWAYVRHIVEPYEVIVEGRSESRIHDSAMLTIRSFRSLSEVKTMPANLPVAGIPVHHGERLTLNRGKVRPALILATPGTQIEQSVRAGFPKGHYAPTYIVAPFFTASSSGAQSGYSAEFVRRTKLCEYTQCFWDLLPLTTEHSGSILRFDQMQAVEPDINSLAASEWILSEDAQIAMNELMIRHLSQARLKADGLVATAVQLLQKHPDNV